ncbi:MAG: histidine kinase [Gemmatimonadales bacterium]|jgi:signal transduction histidine kinase
MNLLPRPYESIRREAGVPRALVAAAIAGVWLVPGLLAGAETYAFWWMAGEPTPPWRAFAAQAPGWLTFAVLTPFVLRLGEWLPPDRGRRLVRVAAHVGIAFALGTFYALVAALSWTTFIGSEMPFRRLALSWYLSGLPTMVLSYFAILGVGRALYWFWRQRRTELEAARLEAQLSEARLAALRMQLNPHFFFNALNTATVLVRDGDQDAAEEVMEILGDLLRETLREGRGHTTTLTEEIEFVRRYLAIERARFSDRLLVDVHVPAELADCEIPAFLLQPLVENAVRHGISRRPGAGRIRVSATRVEGDLVLRVEDDGPGPRAEDGPGGSGSDESAGASVGLANTRARLSVMYDDRASCTLRRGPEGGAIVEVRLPAIAGQEAARA